MGIFSPSDNRPKITAREIKKKVKPALASAGLSVRERARLESILKPSLGGNNVRQKGIDKDELNRTMKALRETQRKHKIMSDKKLDKAEEILRRNL